jgi:hypothetical protein
MKKIDFNMQLDFKDVNLKRMLFVRRYLVLGLVMLIIGLVLIVVAIVPQVSRIYSLQSTVKKEDLNLKKLQQKVKSLREIDYLQAYTSNNKVELALPSEKPLLQLLTSSNFVAQDAGVSISDIDTTPGSLASASASLDAPVPEQLVQPGLDTLQTLTIELNVKGTLSQIYTFLEKIEQVTPITQVTRLQLSSSLTNNTSSTEVFESKMQLTTYYFTQPIFVTVDEPLPEIGTKEQNFLNALDSFIFPEFQKQQQIQGGGSQDLFGIDPNSPQ